MIPCDSTDDEICVLFHEQKSDLMIHAIRSGVYRPDGLIEVTHCP